MVHFCQFPEHSMAICANLKLKGDDKRWLIKTRLLSKFILSQYSAPPEAVRLLSKRGRLAPRAVEINIIFKTKYLYLQEFLLKRLQSNGAFIKTTVGASEKKSICLNDASVHVHKSTNVRICIPMKTIYKTDK